MGLIRFLLQIYSFVVLAAVLMSWVPSLRESAFGRFVASATEPVFARVRALLPDMGGLDLSPMIVLLALQLLQRLLH